MLDFVVKIYSISCRYIILLKNSNNFSVLVIFSDGFHFFLKTWVLIPQYLPVCNAWWYYLITMETTYDYMDFIYEHSVVHVERTKAKFKTNRAKFGLYQVYGF